MATIISMPRLSPTMEEGVLAKWVKKEGDKVSPGDVIAEVETDKANMDFPLEDEGVLLALLVPAGTTVKLGAPVAILGNAGEDITELKKQAASGAPSPAAPPATPNAPSTGSSTGSGSGSSSSSSSSSGSGSGSGSSTGSGSGRIKASPLAKKIAAEKHVDLSSLSGSGPGGRIVRRDVENAQPAATPPTVQRSAGQDRLVPASPMRKTIAKRLVEAKLTVPHFYLTAHASVDQLLALRAQLNLVSPVKVSVNDLVVKALALALRRVPEANASWTGDAILYHGNIDIGVAVSVPDGLITPSVRQADQKSLPEIAAEVKELAERAKQKKLRPEEYAGGSATVSNLGMFGISEFKAIINPPESVILAVGKTEKTPIVVERNGKDAIEDEIQIVQRMALSLSCDHRVVDGVLGARLLGAVVDVLEKPGGFLL